jgi:predicted short-subunit dehydrogenase-like oxidoreductase (DUF2520 family)
MNEQSRTIHSCALVGTGTAARALAPALVAGGLKVVAVAGRNAAAAAALATEVGALCLDPGAAARAADLTIVAVRDDAIAEVAAVIGAGGGLNGRAVVHLAGGLGIEVLTAAREAGANIGKMHPIAALSGGPKRLRGIVWGIDGDEMLLPALMLVVHQLGGWPMPLASVDLPLYHAATVVASNFTLALLAVASELWAASGASLPPLTALLPLLRGTIDNLETLGLEQALTGPIVRGDVATVATHLERVAAAVPAMEPVYRVLAQCTLAIAIRSGRLSGEDIGDLRALLGDEGVLQ